MLEPLVCAFALASACAPGGRAIVTEVYYDAIGDDTGQEFVELFNPTALPVALRGVRLEAGDGAGPARWTLRWTGSVGDTIAAGARYVIGGAAVTPAPNAVVTLDLQNGPDAVRLVWPDGVTEVVGYGALAFAEYSCGAPAADAPAGSSLARVPDDADLGSNALDFRIAPPSPGRANQSARDVAIVAGSLAIDPAQPEPGTVARLRGRAVNRGAQSIAPDEVEFQAEDETIDARTREDRLRSMSAARSAAITPGDTMAFELSIGPLAAGKHVLRVSARLTGDENADDDRDSLRVRVGPGPLAITEIQFHPADGEGEWVEIANRTPALLDAGTFTLSDRGAGRGVPHDVSPLPPDSLAVLAQDRLALLARRPELDPGRVWQVTPWAALNNTDDSAGVADLVVLREADGLVSDRVAYSAAGVPTGVPLEWRDGAWQPALDPRGTPLAPPHMLPAAVRRFDLIPARVPGHGGQLHLDWALPWPRARLRVTLYDLDGREVIRLLPETGAAGRGGRDVTLAGAPAGFYWAVLEARPETGPERIAETRPLRITGTAP